MNTQFYGAHAYVVTQNGARLLLKPERTEHDPFRSRYALPIEHQVDGLFLTMHALIVAPVCYIFSGVTVRPPEHSHGTAFHCFPMHEQCQP